LDDYSPKKNSDSSNSSKEALLYRPLISQVLNTPTKEKLKHPTSFIQYADNFLKLLSPEDLR
jgi:hypothetical protein